MQLSQFRQLLFDALSVDLDNYRGESPSTSDLNAQINWALRFISRRLLLVEPSVVLHLTAGQGAYDLRDITTPTVSRKVVVPFEVVIAGVPLSDRWRRDYGLLSYNEFRRQYPTFRTDPPGTPIAASWVGNNGSASLLLAPKPDSATVLAGTSFVGGHILAPDLVLDTDVPEIPEECHEAVALLAAVYASTPAVTEDEAWTRLKAFGEYHKPVEFIRETNRATIESWGGSCPRIKKIVTESP